ncbi:DUF397 domain-containing protein [Streptomyces sp. JJ38]|uniref:DUF397 domain-containing protein n=1 Tax=Streptomyces sp. JJ38 TaxID=2738128 RepID=UPI001C56AFB8|nr:DUF397 domain-containing protein [Streptomyces sp. JJ38]MBW1598036.1 DUF397 domain-containing protein [Streptomyces sp. JJ38]
MTERIRDGASLNGWRKSSYSDANGGSCVEVLDGYPGGIPVRDSKVPQGPAVVVSPAAWAPFVAGLKASGPPR